MCGTLLSLAVAKLALVARECWDGKLFLPSRDEAALNILRGVDEATDVGVSVALASDMAAGWKRLTVKCEY